jgi:hypothetical protein
MTEETRVGFIEIVNWRKVQGYRKINPPWIKLWTSLLSDEGAEAKWRARERWRSLGTAGQSLVVNLWLYAATSCLDGRIWGDPRFLAAVLPVEGPIDLGPLFAAGFIRWADEPAAAADGVSAGPSGTRGERGVGEREGRAEKAEAEPEPEAQRQSQCAVADSGKASAPERTADSAQEAPKSQRQSHSERHSQGQGHREQPEAQPRQSEQAASQGTVVPGSVRILANPHPPQGPSADPPGPPVSDGRDRDAPGVAVAGRSIPDRSGAARSLAAILAGSPVGRALRLDDDREVWCRAVFDRLRFPFPADSLPGRQELGAYASLYDALLVTPGLTPEARDEILRHDLRTAEKKGREKRRQNKGAVWTKIHKDRVRQYLARAAAARG